MKKLLWAAIAVLVLMLAFSAYVYNLLPETLISHWGLENNPNGFMEKNLFFVFFICLTIAIFLLLVFLPKTDPFKKNYEAFQKEYDLLVFFFVCFMFYIFVLTILVNLGYAVNIGLGFTFALAVLFYVIGLVLGKTKRNWFVGIRTPWSLSDDENWKKTHELGAKLFKLLAVLIIITWLFAFFFKSLEKYIFLIVLAEILILVFVPFFYSYALFAEKQKRK
ncbi:MAG: SdpI family protein [Candidatus ainarchaeum sp.]|nr:SdpI family protein [Candidatus ainarchaeum sp.]